MVDVEAKVKEIHAYAQKFADILYDDNPKENKDITQYRAKVVVEIWEGGDFHGNVFPGVLAIGYMCTIVNRGHQAENRKDIQELLDLMLSETKKEYELYRDTGMVQGIGQ